MIDVSEYMYKDKIAHRWCKIERQSDSYRWCYCVFVMISYGNENGTFDILTIFAVV